MAPAGAIISIISHHGHVKIVEDETGNRFSVCDENLIDDTDKADKSISIDYSYKKVQKQKRKDSVQIQTDLFS
jgi:hypothetical protein